MRELEAMLVLVMLASVSVSGSHDVDNTPVDDLYEEVLAKKLSIEAMPPAPSEAAARRKTHRSVHATNATTVLIVFMNNPTSIDARTKHPDPRFVSLSSTACELVRLGHNVLVEVAGGLSIRPSLAKTQISQHSLLGHSGTFASDPPSRVSATAAISRQMVQR